METDAVDLDLLAPGDKLVSVAFVARELRRHRMAIGAVALSGALMLLAFGGVAPEQAVAHTKVLLQFPAGADPEEAIRTDLEVLRTHAVAQAAVQALGLETDPEILRAQYDGAILTNRILSISAAGNDAAEAERQADAVAAAYLQVREALYREQGDIVVAQQRRQQEALRGRVSGLSEEIKNFDEPTAEVQIDDLLTERTSLNSQIDEIEDTIQTETVETSLIVEGSRVIDVAQAAGKSRLRTHMVNAGIGFFAGLFLASFFFALLAVVTTRVRRRADVAAAMHAPVSVSIGSSFGKRWPRLTHAPSDGDMQLVVRHLEAAVPPGTTSTSALVIVSIDSLRVSTLAAQALARKLVAGGRRVSIVNETGGPLLGQEDRGDRRPTADDGALDADVILVLATLDPAKGAEHLREWAANAVAFVTAGRSSVTKLEAHAAMIRSAALQLRSVVLIGADRDDDSLGIFEDPFAAPPRHPPSPTAVFKSATRST
ncbi:MAG: hypothetical protein ABWZ15_06505 [Acidimicrobiia bacterium]